MKQKIKCPITELDAEKIHGLFHSANSYKLEINGENRFIVLGETFEDFSKEEKFLNNRYLLAGAILTKQLFDYNYKGIDWFSLTGSNFEEKLNKIIYPKTPKEKLDNIFSSLCQMQEFDGHVVKIQSILKSNFYFKYFF